jgi:hypothetical protein
MSEDRRKRVISGRDKFLVCAAHLGEASDTTVDAILNASVEVLLAAMHDDRGLVAKRLRRVADGLEGERTGGMH